MESQFWHDRWNANQISFHQGRVNAMLERHYARLGLGDATRVLVPLCGKAVDMAWIRGHGPAVVGVELSHIAVRDFFRDQRRSYDVSSRGAFELVSADGVDLLCGDFFALTEADLGTGSVQAVYDRAALVALPPDMRRRYVAHLLNVIPATTPILLVTFEYDPAEMQGPPFAVPEPDVRALFEPAGRTVTQLESEDVLDRAQRLKDGGLTQLAECAYLIT